MRRGRRPKSHVVIEVRRGHIALVRGPDRVIVVSAKDGESLPSPEKVRSACLRAEIDATSCSFILPRYEGLIHIGREQRVSKSEALAMARLETEMMAAGDEAVMLRSVSVSRSPRRGWVRTYGVLIASHRVEQLVRWATECGWEPVDFRCAPFEVARVERARVGKRSKPGAVIAFYPGGEWELHWFHESGLASAYAGGLGGNSADGDRRDRGDDEPCRELVDALKVMIVEHGFGDSRPTDGKQVEVKVSGAPPPGVEDALHRLGDEFRDEGLYVAFVSEPAFETDSVAWPKAAVVGALQRRRQLNYPLLVWPDGKGQGGPVRPGPPGLVFRFAAVLAIVGVVTAGLGITRRHIAKDLAALQASTVEFQRESEHLVSQRRDQAILAERVQEVESFFEARHLPLAALFAVENVLPPGAHMDTFFMEGDYLRLGLVAPSVVSVVERMESDAAFSEVTMESPVTIEGRSTDRQERVTIGARLHGWWDR